MKHYTFFQNRKCEFFPCHKTEDSENFNCLFCFCPLYSMGNNCGGAFTLTSSGVKDCSTCLFPHRRENYEKVIEKLSEKGRRPV